MFFGQIRAATDDMGTYHEATASGSQHAGPVRDDALVDAAQGHVDRRVDGIGKAQRVGAAVALHHDAVEPEEQSAARGARIELAAQRRQRPARQNRAQTRKKRALAARCADSPRSAWPCLPPS